MEYTFSVNEPVYSPIYRLTQPVSEPLPAYYRSAPLPLQALMPQAPPPPPQATPLQALPPQSQLPQTETQTNQVKGNLKRVQPQLSKDEKLAVLWIALKRQDAFGAAKVSNKKFWERVAAEVSQLNERSLHTLLEWAIEKLISEWIEKLKEEKSRNQKRRDDFMMTLNDWVQVVQVRNQCEKKQTKIQVWVDSKNAETVIFWQTQLSLWRNKQSLESSESLSDSRVFFSSPALSAAHQTQKWRAVSEPENESFETNFSWLVNLYVSTVFTREAELSGVSSWMKDLKSQIEDVKRRLRRRLNRLETGISTILQELWSGGQRRTEHRVRQECEDRIEQGEKIEHRERQEPQEKKTEQNKNAEFDWDEEKK